MIQNSKKYLNIICIKLILYNTTQIPSYHEIGFTWSWIHKIITCFPILKLTGYFKKFVIYQEQFQY